MFSSVENSVQESKSRALFTSSKCKTRLKVNIKRYHAVAKWTWNAGADEVCGICQSPFEGVAPGKNGIGIFLFGQNC